MRRITALLSIALYWSISTAQIPTNGLVAFYPFSGNANDASGNNNNATVITALPAADRNGVANSAYSFNGTNQFIEIPNSQSLQSPVTAGTISLWANITAWDRGTGAVFVCKGNTQVTGQYKIWMGNAVNEFYIDFNTGSPTGNNIVTGKLPYSLKINTWYHFAVTWNQGTVVFYLNGNSYASGTFAGTVKVDSYPLDFGRDTPGSTEFLNGKLDDIRIYNRALSASEIDALYHEGGWPLNRVPVAQEFFDDFFYSKNTDPRLSTQGWRAVGDSGGPPSGAKKPYDVDQIRFDADTLLLSTSVDANSQTEPHFARLETKEALFYKGTYAARVFLSDSPNRGSSGDGNVETFYSYYHVDKPLNHAECDFEYLPWNSWSFNANDRNATMYMTSWLSDGKGNLQTPMKTSFAGWHTLIFTVHDNEVDYYFDTIASPWTKLYNVPNHYMNISFANWIAGRYDSNDVFLGYDIGSGASPRTCVMKVDWVYYARNVILSKSQVDDIVNYFRTNHQPYVPISAPVSSVSIPVKSPMTFQLLQNYPNPFNPSTTISYSMPKAANVSLRIFNTLGQEVATLVNEHKEAGYYQVTWNANVPSGIYFCRLQAGEYVETRKMILLR